MRSALLFSRFFLKLVFVWPFKLIWWFIRKIFVRDQVDDDYDNYEEEDDMSLDNVLDDAIIFATNAHSGQFRKGTTIPYILHPLEAGAIVATMTTDPEVIAGAVLHDVVEDTDATVQQIEDVFGERVAMLVASESENKREHLSSESTWKIRKQETLDHLQSAPLEVKMIALGDKLSNLRAIYRDYRVLGDDLWQRFNQKDKYEHAWYYGGIINCMDELCKYPAYQEYGQLMEEVFGILWTCL